MRTFLIYWLPVVLWMALIFVMSTSRFSMKGTAQFIEPVLRFVFRKISKDGLVAAHLRVRAGAHFAEYVILNLLLFRALRADSPDAWHAGWTWISMLVTVVYATLDELHQKWESDRTGRIKHVMIDIAGGVTAQLLLLGCALLRQG